MSPKVSNLVDMTDRVRILGDAPMVAGKCNPERKTGHISFIIVGFMANFWLAGTSSGNLVAAKVMRRVSEHNVQFFCVCASAQHVASVSLKQVHLRSSSERLGFQLALRTLTSSPRSG